MRPENAAAAVNAILVLVVPPLAFAAVGLLNYPQNATPVHPPGGEGIPASIALASLLFQMVVVLLPFAALAGWRTRVYARRRLHGQRRGWMSVAEAGGCGFAVALGYLAPGIVTRPAEAPPFIVVYGGAALVLGLLVGLILRTTAMLVLRQWRIDGVSSPG